MQMFCQILVIVGITIKFFELLYISCNGSKEMEPQGFFFAVGAVLIILTYLFILYGAGTFDSLVMPK